MGAENEKLRFEKKIKNLGTLIFFEKIFRPDPHPTWGKYQLEFDEILAERASDVCSL